MAHDLESVLRSLYGVLRRDPLQNLMPWVAQGGDQFFAALSECISEKIVDEGR